MPSKSSLFSQRVWEIATAIPEGRVMTYSGLARAASGGPLAARSITNILSKAPNQSAIPYHRIVYADGRVWLSTAYEKKRRALYRREGIRINARGYIEDFEEVEWRLF